MKKIISSIIMLTISIVIASSQDFEPSQFRFLKPDGSPIYLSADSDYFKQDSFLLGWHWGADKKISQALRMNQNDTRRDNLYVTNLIDSNSHIILKPQSYSHAVGAEVFNARALQFEPTLNIDPDNPRRLVVREGDTTRPVFGFLYKRGRVLDDPNDPDFNRIIIEGDSLINQIILAENFPGNQFSTFGFYDADTNLKVIPIGNITSKLNYVHNVFLGQTLYFSINLRKLDDHEVPYIPGEEEPIGNPPNDIPVLRIKLPISYYYEKRPSEADYIKFDSVPCPKDDCTFELSNGRGMYRKLVKADINQKEFIITKSMLPSDQRDITISAYFTMSGANNVFDNRRIKFGEPNNLSKDMDRYIDSLKMEVEYLGGCPIAIDWLRFETPHARDFLAGKYDDFITSNVQTDLNRVMSDSFAVRRHKLFRYNVVIEGVPATWIAEKYFNKLVGNINTNEHIFFQLPAHYEYYTNAPNKWYGYYKPQSHISVPFSMRSYSYTEENQIKTLGSINGYMGIIESSDTNKTIEYSNDPLDCHYETYILEGGKKSDIWKYLSNDVPYDNYEKAIGIGINGWKASYQMQIEYDLNRLFYINQESNFLFSDRSWWAQGFIHFDLNESSIIENGISKQYTKLGKRPITGEELRQFTTLPVLLGAKGLLYDGASTGPWGCKECDPFKFSMYDHFQIDEGTFEWLESLDDKEFIWADEAGPDYIRENNEVMELNNRFYNLNVISSYMDMPTDKIYIGRKTQRVELNRIHSWIRSIDKTLMNLKLAAWYAKGYRKWYFQDTIFPNNYINNFLNTTAIYTKEIGATMPEGTSLYNFQDSSFYDITILRDKKNNIPLTSRLYLGVQNRRTNPLIKGEDRHYFYSTSDMYNFCQDPGGIDYRDGQHQPREYWQELYWKRLGIREITIPFRLNPYQTLATFDGLFFKVKDVGYSKTATYDIDEYPWRDERYYDLTDTIITARTPLAVKFLPGEGKLYEISPFVIIVRYYPPPDTTVVVTPPDTTVTPPDTTVTPPDSTLPANPCTVCDSVVHANKIEFFIDTLSNCCADLYLSYSGECEFENFPVTIEISGMEKDVSLTDNPDNTTLLETTYAYSKLYTVFYDEFKKGVMKIGRLCKENSTTIFFRILAGGLSDKDSTVCLYSKIYEYQCDTIAPANCCDSLEISFKCNEATSLYNCSFDVEIKQHNFF